MKCEPLRERSLSPRTKFSRPSSFTNVNGQSASTGHRVDPPSSLPVAKALGSASGTKEGMPKRKLQLAGDHNSKDDRGKNSQSKRVIPQMTDVLFGRGDCINRHAGNKTFREMVQKHKKVYMESQFKREKRLIADSIVGGIHGLNPPGRFLRKTAKVGEWQIVDDAQAREKTLQALREKPKAPLHQESQQRAAVESSRPGSLERDQMSQSFATIHQPPQSYYNMPSAVPYVNMNSSMHSSLFNDGLSMFSSANWHLNHAYSAPLMAERRRVPTSSMAAVSTYPNIDVPLRHHQQEPLHSTSSSTATSQLPGKNDSKVNFALTESQTEDTREDLVGQVSPSYLTRGRDHDFFLSEGTLPIDQGPHTPNNAETVDGPGNFGIFATSPDSPFQQTLSHFPFTYVGGPYFEMASQTQSQFSRPPLQPPLDFSPLQTRWRGENLSMDAQPLPSSLSPAWSQRHSSSEPAPESIELHRPRTPERRSTTQNLLPVAVAYGSRSRNNTMVYSANQFWNTPLPNSTLSPRPNSQDQSPNHASPHNPPGP